MIKEITAIIYKEYFEMKKAYYLILSCCLVYIMPLIFFYKSYSWLPNELYYSSIY